MPHRDKDGIVITRNAAGRESLIVESFARLTGEPLVPPGSMVTQILWSLPGAVVAHGTEEDPIFFYANRLALDLFEISASEFIRMPSRLSAEPLAREERAKLMERVTRDNLIDDYSGVRISAKGNRFMIERATVWNLIDAEGTYRGQAAWFEKWHRLED
jgi:PAS domain-containing protein